MQNHIKVRFSELFDHRIPSVEVAFLLDERKKRNMMIRSNKDRKLFIRIVENLKGTRKEQNDELSFTSSWGNSPAELCHCFCIQKKKNFNFD